MATLNEKLLHDVLALTVESRTELVEKIFESLTVGPNRDIDAMWEDEIDRRIEEVKTGVVKLIPEEQVFDEIWPRLNK